MITIRIKKELQKIGGAYYFLVSKEMIEHLELDKDNPLVEWQDDKGKYGKFISFWKSE